MISPTITTMNYRIVFFLISLFLFSIKNTYAQSNVRGLVTDAKDQPLANASVLLLNAKDSSLVKGSVTIKNGEYIFQNIPTGNYIVSSAFSGLKQVYSPVFNLEGRNEEKNMATLRLVENELVLSDIKVTAKK